jgi:DNA-directed RNA polymerase subunit alpha
MPTSAAPIDAGAFLESLSYGSEDLRMAKDLARTSREFRRGLENAVRALPERAGGTGALKRATALYLLSRPEQAAGELGEAADVPQKALLAGRVALENGDPAAAAAAFGNVLGTSLDGPSLLADLATAAALSGDPGMAHKAAAKLPHGADALYAEGIALESDGEYAEAKAKYEQALAKDPQHARALFRLALRLDLEGSEEKALELYKRLLNVQPTPVNALLNAALLFEDLGRYPDAESCYTKILKADPNHLRARIGLRDCEASQTMFFDEDHERREDRRNQILRTPISEFELSVRSRNCLAKMNIESLGDLVKKSEQELLAYKNFGETSLQEIKDILAQKGLRLGMVIEDDAPLFTESRADAEAQLNELFGGGPDEEPDEDEPVAGAPPVALTGDVRTTPIDVLELSIRARRCMETLEIRTVGELIERSEEELMASKNFGLTSLNEVKKKLEGLGLSLRKN